MRRPIVIKSTGRLAYMLGWTSSGGDTYAIVEHKDGNITRVPLRLIRFTDFERPPKPKEVS